jgi:hypothetical protein
MSGLPGDIGPVSVRYAAQIRALLQSQALKRLAAEEEAARDSAHALQAQRVPQAGQAQTERVQPLNEAQKVDMEARQLAEARPTRIDPTAAVAAYTTGKLVNIQI